MPKVMSRDLRQRVVNDVAQGRAVFRCQPLGETPRDRSTPNVTSVYPAGTVPGSILISVLILVSVSVSVMTLSRIRPGPLVRNPPYKR